MKIVDVEGIGPSYAKKLAKAGVGTTNALLKQAADAKGRKALAEASGLKATQILEWVNHADLMRVKGIGPEFSDLLEASGVDTVAELATRNAKNLAEKVVEVNAKKKLVRRIPNEKEIAGWIASAKKLPKLVTH